MKRLASLLIMVVPALGLAAEPLSLDEAVRRALERAPQMSAQTAAVESARSLEQSAGRLPDPALLLGVENVPVSGAEAWSTSRDPMTMQKIGLMQEFPSGRKRAAERSMALARSELSEAERTATGLDVARTVAQAWIRRAAVGEALQSLRSLQKDFELGATAARGALRAGRASTVEALEAESALARFRGRVLQLEGEARQAGIELERWIGEDAHLPAAALPSFEALPLPPDELRRTAHLHASLAPYELRIASAREQVGAARAARRPDWSVEFAYGKRGPDYPDMATVMFRVGLPLFAGNRQDPAIAARSADVRRAQAERDAELTMHAAELDQVLVAWEQAGARLALLDQELAPLARDRSRAALAGYKAGASILRSALEAFQDESELFIERALLVRERGNAWAYLRFTQAGELR